MNKVKLKLYGVKLCLTISILTQLILSYYLFNKYNINLCNNSGLRLCGVTNGSNILSNLCEGSCAIVLNPIIITMFYLNIISSFIVSLVNNSKRRSKESYWDRVLDKIIIVTFIVRLISITNLFPLTSFLEQPDRINVIESASFVHNDVTLIILMFSVFISLLVTLMLISTQLFDEMNKKRLIVQIFMTFILSIILFFNILFYLKNIGLLFKSSLLELIQPKGPSFSLISYFTFNQIILSGVEIILLEKLKRLTLNLYTRVIIDENDAVNIDGIIKKIQITN